MKMAFLDHHLGKIQVTHHRVRPVPVDDGGLFHASLELERDAGRNGVDEEIPPGRDRLHGHIVEDRHVVLGRLAYEFRRPFFHLQLRVCRQGLLKEGVP
jgi:hypothetical protein